MHAESGAEACTAQRTGLRTARAVCGAIACRVRGDAPETALAIQGHLRTIVTALTIQREAADAVRQERRLDVITMEKSRCQQP